MWVNLVYPYGEARMFLNPSRRIGMDRWGVRRWLAISCEGDDSLLTMSPAPDEDVTDEIVKFWEQFGFNMKLKFGEKVAEFCGKILECTDEGVTGKWMPDLVRALDNWGVSCSSGGVRAGKEGDLTSAKNLRKASLISRASDFAGLCPSLSEKFLREAKRYDVDIVKCEEASMRAFGDKVHSLSEIECQIQRKNSAFDGNELELLDRLGWGCTQEELQTFLNESWLCTPEYITAGEGGTYDASFPATWAK